MIPFPHLFSVSLDFFRRLFLLVHHLLCISRMLKANRVEDRSLFPILICAQPFSPCIVIEHAESTSVPLAIHDDIAAFSLFSTISFSLYTPRTVISCLPSVEPVPASAGLAVSDPKLCKYESVATKMVATLVPRGRFLRYGRRSRAR